MSKQSKAADYTHSVWSGKKYDRKQTQADLIRESMAILRNHPTIGKTLANQAEWIKAHGRS